MTTRATLRLPFCNKWSQLEQHETYKAQLRLWVLKCYQGQDVGTGYSVLQENTISSSNRFPAQLIFLSQIDPLHPATQPSTCEFGDSQGFLWWIANKYPVEAHRHSHKKWRRVPGCFRNRPRLPSPGISDTHHLFFLRRSFCCPKRGPQQAAPKPLLSSHYKINGLL